MAKPSQRGASPDDDSWGKIASDLFGIQFNDDDDFELPDDDAPAKPQAAVSANPGPIAPESTAEHPKVEDSDEDTAVVENVEPAKASVSGDEDHDEFWDILESWNWDESAKSTSTPRKTDESRDRRPPPESSRSDGRRSQRDERPRRDEPPRRDEKRPENADKARSRTAEPARDQSAASDNETRTGRPQHDETRRERTPRSEQPPRTRRPEADHPAPERQGAERSIPERKADRPRTRESSSSFVSDEFGAGVDEPIQKPRSRPAPAVRRRDEPKAPSRNPVPSKRTDAGDDFEGDLFVDDLDEEASDDDSFDSDVATTGEPASESHEGENDRPRRRRRRRRRGRGRLTTDSTSPRDEEFEESDESNAADESEEETAENEPVEDDQAPEDDRESRRPRRRRRRRGRRPSEAPAAEVDLDDIEEEHDQSDDEIGDESLDDESELESDDPDEEVVVPVSYEGIPTWEEAISYLVIIPPHDSRGHHRGRGDGQRRDDSRRR